MLQRVKVFRSGKYLQCDHKKRKVDCLHRVWFLETKKKKNNFAEIAVYKYDP